MRELSCADL